MAFFLNRITKKVVFFEECGFPPPPLPKVVFFCDIFADFSHWDGCVVVWMLGVDESSTFQYKIGGTPKFRIKKLTLTPNFHIFRIGRRSSGGGRQGREAPLPAEAARAPVDAKNMNIRGYRQVFDSKFRGTPNFLSKR